MFAHQDQRGRAGNPAEHLIGGVDNVPLAHDFPLGRNMSFHKDRTSLFETYSQFRLPNWALGCQTEAQWLAAGSRAL